MQKHRLQKVIAEAGFCSRRKAEHLIRAERVTINGNIAKVGDKADVQKDVICIDNLPLSNTPAYKVILLNKPINVISTCDDPQGRKTVLELIPDELRYGLYPIGRLDLNSRGAILLTNNGELTLRLTHPSFLHDKTYLVWVKGIPSERSLNKWRMGLLIDGRITMKASIKRLEVSNNKSLLKIVLREGRKRQIRRVAKSLGHPVIDLKRTEIAGIKLNELKEGEWREVTDEELTPILNSMKGKG